MVGARRGRWLAAVGEGSSGWRRCCSGHYVVAMTLSDYWIVSAPLKLGPVTDLVVFRMVSDWLA
jgi:hypothetical protein